MELVERYIYAVTHRLHEKQRADIEQELRGLIEDMLEDRLQGREATPKDIEEVLLELGEPCELADKYRGYKRYLISPEMFPFYLTIMKIVLASVGLAMLVVFCIETIIDHTQVLQHFVDGLISLFNASLQGFAWVTIAFGIIEYAGVKKDVMRSKRAWKPSELPELPDHRSQIKRSNPIASIVFTILFAALITFSIDLFGVWRFQDGAAATVVPFFNESVFRGFVPYILALLSLTLIKDGIKLITSKWTTKLIVFDIIITALHFVLALFMFADMSIWNAGFIEQLAQTGLVQVGSEEYASLSETWNVITSSMIYIIGLILIIGMVSSIYKLFKLSRMNR